MSRKRNKKKRAGPFIYLFLGFFGLGIVIGLFVAGKYFYDRSRVLPPIDETNLVTELPPGIGNVLGAKTGYKDQKQTSVRVPILLYHYVEYVRDRNDTIRISLNIVPSFFEAQIKTLRDNGYTFITPAELTAAMSGKGKLPKKPVILSFDDGYMDFYTDVYPVITENKVKVVAYIIPDFLDHLNYMDTSQVEEIAKSPFVEIGAHTMHHVWLKNLNSDTAKKEIEDSKKQLEDLLGIPVTSFAYPYGAFDQETLKLVEEAGFTNAVSTVPGIEVTSGNRYFLYRLRPGYRTGQELINFLAQDKFSAY